jgi:hypothetical protein
MGFMRNERYGMLARHKEEMRKNGIKWLSVERAQSPQFVMLGVGAWWNRNSAGEVYQVCLTIELLVWVITIGPHSN